MDILASNKQMPNTQILIVENIFLHIFIIAKLIFIIAKLLLPKPCGGKYEYG